MESIIHKRKLISFIIGILILLFMWTSIKIMINKEKSLQESTIKAEIVKVLENSFEVKIKEEKSGFRIDDPAYVSIKDNKNFNFDDFKEGDYIKITYDLIRESYPAQISAIKILKYN